MTDETEQIILELEKNKDVRQNLAALRQQIKECAGNRTEILDRLKNVDLKAFLAHEDPKTRKNAALLAGDLGMEEYLEAIFRAYREEATLFVRSAYLSALQAFDCTAYSEELEKQYKKLSAVTPKENEKKHIEEEMRQLGRLLVKLNGVKKHTFVGLKKAHTILLTTNPSYREITAAQIRTGRTKLVSSGVLVQTDSLVQLLKIRTFRELLFPLKTGKLPLENAAQAGKNLVDSELLNFLKECHNQGNSEEAPFYFRLDIRARLPLDKKSDYAKKAASAMEAASGRMLLNSTSDYEVEIRLIQTKNEDFCAYVKLASIPMTRFTYRKNSIAASIHPVDAALLMKLAEPYLTERAQILDPFCGVGTMLIERHKLAKTRYMYGTDTFGEAVEKGRENAKLAETEINFIHRDFFDFTHEYLFDEIITNMPVRGRKTREEQDSFYSSFFEKAYELLKPGGRIFMYSNENGFVKKQLRLRKELHLQKEFLIREKEGCYFFIIEVRGK